jgi:hypothetical protein
VRCSAFQDWRSSRSRRYISLPLTFIASELAFEGAAEAHDFLLAHAAAVYQATDSVKPGTAEDTRNLDCKSVRAALAASLQNYTKVDIK